MQFKLNEFLVVASVYPSRHRSRCQPRLIAVCHFLVAYGGFGQHERFGYIAVAVFAPKVTQLCPKTCICAIFAPSCDSFCPKTDTALIVSLSVRLMLSLTASKSLKMFGQHQASSDLRLVYMANAV